MSAVPRSIVGIGLAVAAVVVAIVLSRSSPKTRDAAPPPTEASETTPPPGVPVLAEPTTPPVATAPTTPTAVAPRDPAAPPSATPVIEDVMKAAADLSVDGTIVLLTAIDSKDAVVVAEATNALVARGAVAALPVLVDQDVIGRPAAAPSLIDAMGRLAAIAPPEQKSEAVDRLLALMREEKLRGAQESQGNLLQIYEALGHTGDPRAIPPLEAELVDPTVKTAPKVVVIQALVALKATSSRPVLERLAAQLSAPGPVDAFEAELRRDLLAAIREALVKLS